MIRNALFGLTLGILALLAVRPAAANHFEYLAADYPGYTQSDWASTRVVKQWAIDGTFNRWCSDDIGAGQTQLRQLFAANVFAVWEPVLPITDWVQDCGAYDVYIRIYLSSVCGGAPGCYQWNPFFDSTRGGYYAAGGEIKINDADANFDTNSLIAAVNHEIGHHYGLHEQYIDDGSPFGCGTGPSSVMDAVVCDSIYPTTTDVARVQAFYDVAPAANVSASSLREHAMSLPHFSGHLDCSEMFAQKGVQDGYTIPGGVPAASGGVSAAA